MRTQESYKVVHNFKPANEVEKERVVTDKVAILVKNMLKKSA